MKYLLRLLAILVGIVGAVIYFFFDMNNVAYTLFAIGGVILFIDMQIKKK